MCELIDFTKSLRNDGPVITQEQKIRGVYSLMFVSRSFSSFFSAFLPVSPKGTQASASPRSTQPDDVESALPSRLFVASEAPQKADTCDDTREAQLRKEAVLADDAATIKMREYAAEYGKRAASAARTIADAHTAHAQALVAASANPAQLECHAADIRAAQVAIEAAQTNYQKVRDLANTATKAYGVMAKFARISAQCPILSDDIPAATAINQFIGWFLDCAAQEAFKTAEAHLKRSLSEIYGEMHEALARETDPISQAAYKALREHGNPYRDKFQRKVSNAINKELSLVLLSSLRTHIASDPGVREHILLCMPYCLAYQRFTCVWRKIAARIVSVTPEQQAQYQICVLAMYEVSPVFFKIYSRFPEFVAHVASILEARTWHEHVRKKVYDALKERNAAWYARLPSTT